MMPVKGDDASVQDTRSHKVFIPFADNLGHSCQALSSALGYRVQRDRSPVPKELGVCGRKKQL